MHYQNFSTKSIQYKHHKEPHNTSLGCCQHGNRHTERVLVNVPRINNYPARGIYNAISSVGCCHRGHNNYQVWSSRHLSESYITAMNLSNSAKNWFQYAQNRVARPTSITKCIFVVHCIHAHQLHPLCIVHTNGSYSTAKFNSSCAHEHNCPCVCR